MALTELLNKKLEIPIFDIGDFIKNHKKSLISTIKTHYKNYKDTTNAQEALRSQPPIKPPDGPRNPQTSANRPPAATNSGYPQRYIRKPVPQKSESPLIDRYEIPLARNEDFVQIQPSPACSGAIYFDRGDQIGHGIFKDIAGRSIKRMAPPDSQLVEQANYLLETTEEIGTHKLPTNHSDIPPNFTVVDPKFREILDIIYKNRRL